MSVGLYIIGDEILSGHRQDKHLSKVVDMLTTRGYKLSWVKFLPDDEGMIARELRGSFERQDVVFSCGGIGSTPDDLTRQSCARALGVSLVEHQEGARILHKKFTNMLADQGKTFDLSRPENKQRMQMIYLPPDAKLIPNAFNQVPGFYIHDHYFVPGFPEMAWPMLEWVLDNPLKGMKQDLYMTKAVRVYETLEADLNWILEKVLHDWPMVKIHSLPHIRTGHQEGCVEVGVKSLPQDEDALKQAYQFVLKALQDIDSTTEIVS
ncbi:MAG: molybdopterin-binding protein [Alcaligenaceae bacterium]|nr:molybdopterin-binding protein [Alcaligenaceae bacterium]